MSLATSGLAGCLCSLRTGFTGILHLTLPLLSSLNPFRGRCMPGFHSLLLHSALLAAGWWRGHWLQRNLRAQRCRSICGTAPSATGAGGAPGHLPTAGAPPCALHLTSWASPAELFQGIPRGPGSPKSSQGPAVFSGVEFDGTSPIASWRNSPAVSEIIAAKFLNTAVYGGQKERPEALPTCLPAGLERHRPSA